MKKRVKKNVGKARRRLKKMGRRRRRSGLGQLQDEFTTPDYRYASTHAPHGVLTQWFYDTCVGVLENVARVSRYGLTWWANNTDRPLSEYPTREQFLAQPDLLVTGAADMLRNAGAESMIPGYLKTTLAIVSGNQDTDLVGSASSCVKPTSLKSLSGLGQITRASDVYGRRNTNPDIERPLALDSFELRLALAEKDVEAARADNNKCMRAFNSAADVAWETARLVAVSENRPLGDQGLADRIQQLDENFRAVCRRT